MDKKHVTRGGKPFQSKLLPYEAEVKALSAGGVSVRKIASEMLSRHGINISHNAVASFLRTHGARKRRNFLDGIPETRRQALLSQLRAVWTHGSTAIEGNTLTLGDTMAVLEYGLTVKGKPLKDHQDVVAHARGVDFIQTLLEKARIRKDDIFALHRIVVSGVANDIYRPIGAWKREDNGTYGADGGKSVYMSYAYADDTPKLMMRWIEGFNKSLDSVAGEDSALDAYLEAHVSFVRIHPFFDGNGRIARLLSNLPVLRAGYPPIVIPMESRLEYIERLWEYQRSVGIVRAGDSLLLPKPDILVGFKEFLRGCWRTTIDLVAEASGV